MKEILEEAVEETVPEPVAEEAPKDRLIWIGERLAKLRKEAASLAFSKTENELYLQERYSDLVPDGGWPGSNKEARDAAEKKDQFADEISAKIRATILELTKKAAETNAEIDGLVDERRALEWVITRKLADALETRNANLRSGLLEIVQAEAQVAVLEPEYHDIDPEEESQSPYAEWDVPF